MGLLVNVYYLTASTYRGCSKTCNTTSLVQFEYILFYLTVILFKLLNLIFEKKPF
jgi:hypothetical protein